MFTFVDPEISKELNYYILFGILFYLQVVLIIRKYELKFKKVGVHIEYNRCGKRVFARCFKGKYGKNDPILCGRH